MKRLRYVALLLLLSLGLLMMEVALSAQASTNLEPAAVLALTATPVATLPLANGPLQAFLLPLLAVVVVIAAIIAGYGLAPRRSKARTKLTKK